MTARRQGCRWQRGPAQAPPVGAAGAAALGALRGEAAGAVVREQRPYAARPVRASVLHPRSGHLRRARRRRPRPQPRSRRPQSVPLREPWEHRPPPLVEPVPLPRGWGFRGPPPGPARRERECQCQRPVSRRRARALRSRSLRRVLEGPQVRILRRLQMPRQRRARSQGARRQEFRPVALRRRPLRPPRERRRRALRPACGVRVWASAKRPLPQPPQRRRPLLPWRVSWGPLWPRPQPRGSRPACPAWGSDSGSAGGVPRRRRSSRTPF